jgi:predicted Zn finger-like uncharacterized protein
MKIKCPECATGYNIPDSTLGDKPRKMKCAKCKNIFAVARRSEETPQGYEEFTASGGGLPPEFAFLKASVPPTQAPQPSIPSLSEGGTFVGHAPTNHPSSAPPVTSVPDMKKTVLGQPAPAIPDHKKAPPPPIPAAANAAPPVVAGNAPGQPSPGNGEFAMQFPESALDQAQSPAARAAVDELRQGGAIPVRNSLPAENMFGSSASGWEGEAPMELGSYAVSQAPEPHHGHQLAGKVAFGVIIVLIAFFLFVAGRNGWSLSLSALPEQVSFAFSSSSLEEIPESAENIEATVVTKKVVTSSRGTYLIVSGEVINNNPSGRSHILLRGRLYDGQGELRGEARMPCGRAIDKKIIRKTPAHSISQHYMDKGRLHNCQIGPNGNRIFQVVFNDLPDDYDAGFDIRVNAIAATIP